MVDEVSMLTPDLLDNINLLASRFRHIDAPMGGIQLVLAGGMLQLGPMCQGQQPRYCFEADYWNKVVPHTVRLMQSMHQADPVFRAILDEARMGVLSAESEHLLRQRLHKTTDASFAGIQPTRIYRSIYLCRST